MTNYAIEAPLPTNADDALPRLPARVICVLGMHRSGTSCLTGSLQASGLFLGKHSKWNPFNVKGNRENPDVVALHDDILACNGGSWDNPPSAIRWSPAHRARALEIATGHADAAAWCFKDPRSLLVLQGWKELLGPRLQLIGIFRNPRAVVESLYGRGSLDREHNLRLWQHYNRRLLQEFMRQRLPLLDFDWPEQRFHERLHLLQQRLGLPSSAPAERFYDAQLKRQPEPDRFKLPVSARWMHMRLRLASLW